MIIDGLKSIANTPIYTGELAALLDGYKSPEMKITAMEGNNEIIRLKRGMYVINGNAPISRGLCSNQIYGPSYVSLQWALSYYGLIPERVRVLTAVTTKRSRNFKNSLGYFTYRQVPKDYFLIGINFAQEDGITFLMASPEKALCDMILADPYLPAKSIIGLERYLLEDLRFDTDAFADFNISVIENCAEQGKKKTILENLIKIIKRYEHI